MSAKFKEKTISDSTYRVNQFVGTTSFKMLVEVTKLLGPGLASLPKLIPKDGSSILDSDTNILGEAIQVMMGKLDPTANLDLIIRLLASTSCDNSDINLQTFDLVFQGKMLTLFKVIMFVLEVNYSDFLKESGLKGRKESQENTTPT